VLARLVTIFAFALLGKNRDKEQVGLKQLLEAILYY